MSTSSDTSRAADPAVPPPAPAPEPISAGDARASVRGGGRGVSPDAWALIGLGLATLWIYLPLGVLQGGLLYGSDSLALHVRRLEFAREHLFGPSPHLPAWYPREFMGTPFWSNLQNFPLLPTRLPLLLVNPWDAHAYGVNIAAVLTASFTYLWCRRVGLGRAGAAVAGWTFACGAFFASRVMAGHLPLLEAYPALPLLLWLVERYAASRSTRALRLNLLALGLASGTVMLAGHPQLPLYALAAAFLYLPVRAGARKAFAGAAAMAAGVACMSFALYPMVRLVGRSTRTLTLDPPSNDVAFPVSRLKAFVLPSSDVPKDLYVYWDTGCYVGLLPLAALAGLLIWWAVRRKAPAAPWVCVLALGAAALLLAFPRPWADGAGGSWTLLRSPARQVYITVFALAAAAGYAADALLRTRPARGPAWLGAAAVVVLTAAHAWDVRSNVARFVAPMEPVADNGIPTALAAGVGDGRVAMDTDLVDPTNRRLDDVGVFDSLLLARPYSAMMALSGQPPMTNKQLISGGDLGARALAWCGARVVLTFRKDMSLPLLQKGEAISVYAVPGPLPRAGFVPLAGVRYADEETVLAELRGGAAPDPARMFLPPRPADDGPAGPPSSQAGGATAAAGVTYRRPGPDHIEVDVSAPAEGYVRILEAFDPGWTATVDGQPAELVVADGFVSAVRVQPGRHQVRMTYRTPGVTAGLILSAAGAAALGVVASAAPRFVRPGATP